MSQNAFHSLDAATRAPEDFHGAQPAAHSGNGEHSHQIPPESLTTVVDMKALAERCLGNMGLVMRVVTKFRNTGAADLQQIEAAIEQSDFETIARISHRIKGAAGNISASRLRLMASYIEQSAREQSISEIREAFAQARAEWDAFVEFATSIATQGSPATPAATVRAS